MSYSYIFVFWFLVYSKKFLFFSLGFLVLSFEFFVYSKKKTKNYAQNFGRLILFIFEAFPTFVFSIGMNNTEKTQVRKKNTQLKRRRPNGSVRECEGARAFRDVGVAVSRCTCGGQVLDVFFFFRKKVFFLKNFNSFFLFLVFFEVLWILIFSFFEVFSS